MMDTNLLQVVACPVCKGELSFDRKHQELICRFDRIAFPVQNDIPMLMSKYAHRLEGDDQV